MSSTQNSVPPVIREQDIIGILPSASNPSILYLTNDADANTRLSKTEALSNPLTAGRMDIQDKYRVANAPQHLQVDPSDLHVVVSVKSGTQKAEACFENVVRPLLYNFHILDHGFQVLKTDSENSVREFAGGVLRDKALKGAPQTVILLSGDGGVVDIVNGLMGGVEELPGTFVRPTLITLPLGTGNALFHSHHRAIVNASTANPNPDSPSDLTLALRNLLVGTSHPLPIFRTTFSSSARLLTNEGQTASPIPNNTIYGTIVASYGFHATLVADSDTTAYRLHGAKRFGMIAHELLSPASGADPHAYKANLTLHTTEGDKTVERDTHGYVLLTLVSNLEETFTISPASQPLDGLMRVVYFGPEKAEVVMRIMGEAYAGGEHVKDDKVAYEEVTGMTIEILEVDGHGDQGLEGRWRRVCIDGLIVRLGEGGRMEVTAVEEKDWPVQVALDPSVLPRSETGA